MVDDKQLEARAVRGDPEALAQLLKQHYSLLRKYSLKLTLHPAHADDLTQDTMLRAIERIGTYQLRAAFSTWLISIASRLYLDGIRRRKRESRWQAEEQSLHAIRYQMRSIGMDWPEALDALGRLQPDVRAPIVLKHYYGYSQDEIAAMLDIPSGTVKSRIHNGIKQVREELNADA
ncbi:RNA polymerase sigma factor SigY [Paenibacillus kobensis]|uniref:RNA polymerase sigma factor SigY n=1 Tax=Paenibacillus kobensis TaxID=59841 RepID=UPI000FDC9A6B|nr:RNA polymerase sigma factor SigY [Paenibacillus kobensis]